MRRAFTLEAGLGALAVGVGATIGSARLADNSFLTHLATGRVILDTGFPRTDPYTFTAAGEPWVVQSWLASVLYAGAEELGGLGAVRLLMVATCAVLGGLAWALTRSSPSLLVRLVLVGTVLFIGTTAWPERPLLLGLVALGLALLAGEGRLDPRWLVPTGWVWANVHGSWPIGLVALGCVLVGARLDGDEASTERRSLLLLGAGVVLGAINPYGPAILLFPAHMLSRRESLEGIVEWEAMDFSRPSDWAFLALLLAGVVALVRRPTWRAAVPLVVFGAAAITGLRNVPLAALVLLPGLASGLGDLGSFEGDRRSPLARPLGALGVLVGVLAVVAVLRTDDFDDEPYPVDADEWLRDNDLSPASHRIVARELVGNWFEARYGPTGTVFVDDRMEVIPPEVVADHRTLLRGEPGWDEVLERYEPAAVIWQVDEPLAELLELDDGWTITHRDERWIVAVPTGG